MSENTGTVGARDTPGLPPITAARRMARRRRPTGAPPPLPHPVSFTTAAWLILVIAVLAAVIAVSLRAPSLRLDDHVNTAALRFIARARTPWLTDVASGIQAAGSGWALTAVGLSAVALTMALRRWRHLVVFLCSLGFVKIAGVLINRLLGRPRPYGVPIIAGWAGYSAPALHVAILTTLLLGIAYCLVVPGRPRSYAKAATAVLVGAAAWPACTWRSIAWTTSSWLSRSVSRSRSARSVSSPRTRYSRSPTGAATPLTWT